ncbi:MAG: hypothetical protein IJJ47_07540 [Methanosphaera sp.]|nr:hypothetical protein [Methanosphaera sp.]
MKLKTVSDASILQRFFKKSKQKCFNQINEILLSFYNLKPEIIVLDGTGFTSDQRDIYYRKRTKKNRISYTKTIFQ